MLWAAVKIEITIVQAAERSLELIISYNVQMLTYVYTYVLRILLNQI